MTMPLFAAPTEAGERPPIGEYTHIEKLAHPPFLPEIAARALASLSDEWQWHTVEVIHADENNRFHSPRIGTRIRFNIPTVGARGAKKWPPLTTDRVLIVTEGQEREAAARWERDHNACHGCGGDGLQLDGSHHLNGTRYRLCRQCDGTGAPRGAE
jgi:hypothetical protein